MLISVERYVKTLNNSMMNAHAEVQQSLPQRSARQGCHHSKANYDS